MGKLIGVNLKYVLSKATNNNFLREACEKKESKKTDY